MSAAPPPGAAAAPPLPQASGPSRAARVLALLLYGSTLLLVLMGSHTTTIGAGMVFEDWPTSNGSFNPPGWLADPAMRAEHAHRLLGALVGLLAIALAVVLHLREPRVLVRRLGYAVVLLVVVQGLLGGFRVLEDSLLYALIHGISAQLVLATMAVLGLLLSRGWQRVPEALPGDFWPGWKFLRVTGLCAVALLLVQLTLGATLRHKGAGLAIPFFPHAAPDGGFLPVYWNWATTLHFSHRAMAVVLLVVLGYWAMKALANLRSSPLQRSLAFAALSGLTLQIFLGGAIIWTGRSPLWTNAHVLLGALLLSVSVCLVLTFWRARLKPALAGPAALQTPSAAATRPDATA